MDLSAFMLIVTFHVNLWVW